MLDAEGVYQPIEHFKKQQIIDAELEPVLMFRALRTNLRLLDVVMLNEMEMGHAVRPLLESMLHQYRLISGDARPSIARYLAWLCRKVLRQELPLILAGYEMSSGRWQDLGRNISLLGEEVDLEDVSARRHPFHSPHDYCGFIERHFHNTETILSKVCDLALTCCGTSVMAQPLAEIFWVEIGNALQSGEVDRVWTQTKGDAWSSYNIELRTLKERVALALGGPFINWIPCPKNAEYRRFHQLMSKRFSDAFHLELPDRAK